MSQPFETRRKSIRSGTFEVAQGADTWLDLSEPSFSQQSIVIEESLDTVSTRSFKVVEQAVSNAIAEVNCENPNFLSKFEAELLRTNSPLESNETEELTVFGNRGIWVNREEIANWNGNINEYVLNEDSNPEIVEKKVQTALHYIQELAVRYLSPPTPPPPGDIVITQEQAVLAPPAPPLVIRQQPPRPSTPEPLIVREIPPPPPPAVGRKIITISAKKLPPPPRKVVVERLAPIPSRPQAIITERWLPYQQSKRRVIYHAPPPDPVYCKPRNVIVQWLPPEVVVTQEVKFLGIVKADPAEYVRRYGQSLKKASEFPAEVRNIPLQANVTLAADYVYPPYELEGDIEALAKIDLDKEDLGIYRRYLAKSSDSAQEGSQSM